MAIDDRLLRVAAHLALASAVALVEALDGLEKGNSPGCVRAKTRKWQPPPLFNK